MLVARNDDTALMALDAGLKGVEWEQTTTEWTTYRPFVRGGVILVGARDSLCSFETADGTTIDCIGVPGMVRSIAQEGDQLFVGTIGGTVFSNPGR